ncbi:MAG TPA: Do family serine endopeptidase [Candidatus Polarisedimenticolia bacterium]|nr:Do family serine endopeptidase [Candidatus Polarisedimenticolia bacterium]
MERTGNRPLSAAPLLPIGGTAAVLLLAGAITGAALATFAGRPARRDDPGLPPRLAAPGTGSPGGSPAVAGLAPDGYAAIARAVMPAVVNISSLQVVQTYERYSPFFADPFFNEFFGGESQEFVVPRERRALSLGSGVVVDDRGTILTNNHVVENAREVRIGLADGREIQGRILGVDARTDLAVLRVDGAALPKAVMGDSETMQVGDIVLAIGDPFGLGGTVTMGIVSAIGRGNLGLADYEDFIQTDAAINPGNSGGALVNTRGEVIGINTAILSRSGGYQGIGFAIPSNMARDVLDSIVKSGRVIRGYAGISVQGITPEIARGFNLGDTRGALVSSLDPSGPAAAAGLRPGDVVVSLQGKPITTDDDLRAQLSRLKPGDRVALGLQRNGRRITVDLALAEPPQATRRGRPRG